LARQADPQASKKNEGRARVVSSQPVRVAGRPASPYNFIFFKKFALVYINYFFMDSCISVSNSYIAEKDKYYVFFNVLKFKEYIVYVII